MVLICPVFYAFIDEAALFLGLWLEHVLIRLVKRRCKSCTIGRHFDFQFGILDSAFAISLTLFVKALFAFLYLPL